MASRSSTLLVSGLALALAGCGSSDDGAFDVAFIDSDVNLFEDGVRLSAGGQHVRAAIRSGLVALDQDGEVVPALADRWNVTENGRIFVFRLRDGNWPDGEALSADSVRIALNRAIRDLRGTSLGLDLAPVTDVRAMAGRVIEIRLSSAVPNLLQLLAQPELGLHRGEGETGPMVLRLANDSSVLEMKPPEQRGLPLSEDWQDYVRPVQIHALTATEAIEGFEDGGIEVVLGGRIGAMPLVNTGPLSRGTVRLDPAIGLFGVHVRRANGVLETSELREALAMALDRAALLEPFNIGGWQASTRVVTPGLPGDPGLVPERWADRSIDELREAAAARIAEWRAGQEDIEAMPRIAMLIGDEPGNDILFRELAAQWRLIGVELVRAESRAEADLLIVDRIARYAAPRWFLNQFNCGLERGLCDDDVDFLVGQALDEDNVERRTYLLAEAEADLTLSNIYIPFGPPIRWSLVRGNVDGFSGNLWAFHPLSDLAVIPK